ncbi:FMN reductase [Streptomyces uncialis]|uniref:NADH-dependent FMN reductase n=1 Tax=Streptomyces uncialis TaxID=1048205 RepID=A0A1Q4UXD5_9ACTN|nr:FMN reductase [Streptomyces uncialis]MCX4662211.1 FMN reductase [Streptomyces uncialis]OKH90254.1 NADH-dependent FMN reductase [Streptomyces uncialis]WTE09467.1 FMN reductase [Streptomyces uncialis]
MTAAPLRVVAVVGTLSAPSRTTALVELILATLAARTAVDTRLIELHTLGPAFTGATDRDQVDDEVADALRAVEEADLVIAATPVFRGSYTGLFKHFFDLVDQYGLAAKPVLLAATGGSDRHALVIEHAMRPLFGFLQAWTAPAGIYLNSGDFDGTTILNPEVYERIEMAVNDVVPVAGALAAVRAGNAAPVGPVHV